MKKITLSLVTTLALAAGAWAGTEYSGKEMKQVAPPPPCPEWYADTEWNVSLWGTYAWTAENWKDDQYFRTDHGWGGGADVKYFFHRYFGIGVEGFGLSTTRRSLNLVEAPDTPNTLDPESLIESGNGPRKTRFVGAVLGTLTFRFPLHCSRFSPYIYGGAGAIFGGGEKGTFVNDDSDADSDITRISDSDTEVIGQIGGGLEIRLTRHIGIINDFNWNFVGRDNSDFGMIRGGINFAF